jgi:hypothetical protein
MLGATHICYNLTAMKIGWPSMSFDKKIFSVQNSKGKFTSTDMIDQT